MCKAGRRWVINLYVHLASFTPLSILTYTLGTAPLIHLQTGYESERVIANF